MYNNNSYKIALLSQEGKFNCVKGAKSLPFTSHDKLTRFLIKANLKCSANLKKLPQKGVLFFDDTVIPINIVK